MKLVQVFFLVVLAITPTFTRLASDQIGHCLLENVENKLRVKFVCYVNVYDKHILAKSKYLSMCYSTEFFYYPTVRKDEIRTATFMNCEMNSLPNGFFAAYSGLEVLDLSNLKLQTFSTEVIDDIGSLNNLTASFNNLTEVPLIPSSNELTHLDLSGNSIVLNTLSFKNFELLVDLRLGNNGLRYLPEGIFRYQEHLEFVDLSNNRMTSIDMKEFLPSFKSLKILQLDDNELNKLSELPGTLFMNLDFLSLENNLISCEYLKRFVDSNGLQRMRFSQKTLETNITNLINNGYNVCQMQVITTTGTDDYYEDNGN